MQIIDTTGFAFLNKLCVSELPRRKGKVKLTLQQQYFYQLVYRCLLIEDVFVNTIQVFEVEDTRLLCVSEADVDG